MRHDACCCKVLKGKLRGINLNIRTLRLYALEAGLKRGLRLGLGLGLEPWLWLGPGLKLGLGLALAALQRSRVNHASNAYNNREINYKST